MLEGLSKASAVPEPGGALDARSCQTRARRQNDRRLSLGDSASTNAQLEDLH